MPINQPTKPPARPAKGTVRIIAGLWRSRRLAVVDVAGLRPTGDRVRETLFNWLQSYISGASCVDLFAGTGALGFEAASRGAEKVVMVERNRQAFACLVNNVELLDASTVQLRHGDALAWLDSQSGDRYNILFVDPPFSDSLHAEVLLKIQQSGCLSAGGFVYLETPVSMVAPELPTGWSLWKGKIIGDIRLQVFRR